MGLPNNEAIATAKLTPIWTRCAPSFKFQIQASFTSIGPALQKRCFTSNENPAMITCVSHVCTKVLREHIHNQIWSNIAMMLPLTSADNERSSSIIKLI